MDDNHSMDENDEDVIFEDDEDEFDSVAVKRIAPTRHLSCLKIDLNTVMEHQSIRYDPFNLPDMMFANTMMPLEAFQNLEVQKKLSFDQALSTSDLFSSPTDIGPSINDVFVKVLSEYLYHADIPLESDCLETLSNFRLNRMVYDPNANGSCFFGAMDYVMNGDIDFSSMPYSPMEKDNIRHQCILKIKKRFSEYIKAQILLVGVNSNEAKDIMMKFVDDRGFDEIIETQRERLSNHTNKHIQRCIVENTNLHINVAGSFKQFCKWLDSDRYWTLLKDQEIEELRSEGIDHGCMRPSGYLHHSCYGGQVEMSLIPKIFRRQVICVNVSDTIPTIGLGLNNQSSKGMMILPGILADLCRVTVYTTEDVSREHASQYEGFRPEPLLFVRSSGNSVEHFAVFEPDDQGARLQQILELSKCYKDLRSIYESCHEFLKSLYRSLVSPVCPPSLNNADLVGQVSSVLTSWKQACIVIYSDYEMTKRRMQFLKMWVDYCSEHNLTRYITSNLQKFQDILQDRLPSADTNQNS